MQYVLTNNYCIKFIVPLGFFFNLVGLKECTSHTVS